MSVNVTLGSFGTLQNSSIISTLNANNLLIETAFSDCSSLSGMVPNQYQSNLDMNSFDIINLPAPSTINSPVRLSDISSTIGFNPTVYGLLGGNNTWSGINTFSQPISGNLAAGSFSSTQIFNAGNITQIPAGGGLFRWSANNLTVRDQTNNTSGILGYGWWYQYLINSTVSSGSKQAIEIDLSITSAPATLQAAGLTFCTARPTLANSVNLTGTALAPLGGLFVLNPQMTNSSGGTYVNGMTNVEFDMANACASAPPQYLTFQGMVLTAAHTTAAAVENNGIFFGRQSLSSPGLWSLIQDGTTSGFPMLDATVGAIFQAMPHLGHTDTGTINMGFDLSKYLAITSYVLLGPQSNGYIDGNFKIKAAGLNMPLTTPASSSATGVAGAIEWDAGFVYVCTATNTWKRAALSTF